MGQVLRKKSRKLIPRRKSHVEIITNLIHDLSTKEAALIAKEAAVAAKVATAASQKSKVIQKSLDDILLVATVRSACLSANIAATYAQSFAADADALVEQTRLRLAISATKRAALVSVHASRTMDDLMWRIDNIILPCAHHFRGLHDARDETCSICLDGFDSSVHIHRNSCGHTFHKWCWMEGTIRTHKRNIYFRCPICRA